MTLGKLIVIEGTDGSGKTTQWELLQNRIEKAGHFVRTVDFPQYSRVSSGLINNYLRGVYGKADAVSPYASSLFYALDRFDLSFNMRKWLSEGKFVIANRYVASNGGHQGGKIKNEKEREEFLEWLYDTEYRILGIPKPDVNVFLNMPVEVSIGLADKRGMMKDEHESNPEHLKNAYEAYYTMIKKFPDEFVVINCVDGDHLFSPEEIHQRVWKAVSEKLGLPDRQAGL